TPREFPQLRLIERVIKTRLQRKPVPTLSDVAEAQREQLKERLIKVLEENKLGEFRELAEDLLAEYDPSDLVAAALKLVSGEGKPAQPPQTEFGDTGA